AAGRGGDGFAAMFLGFLQPWFCFAVLVPAVVLFVRRFPLGARPLRVLPIHAIAAVAYAVLHLGLIALVNQLRAGRPPLRALHPPPGRPPAAPRARRPPRQLPRPRRRDLRGGGGDRARPRRAARRARTRARRRAAQGPPRRGAPPRAPRPAAPAFSLQCAEQR